MNNISQINSNNKMMIYYFWNGLSFWENKLFSTKFIEQIIYYTWTKIKLSTFTHWVGLRLVILNLESQWRYSRSWPIPWIMLKSFLQSNSFSLCGSNKFRQKKQKKESED